MQFPLTLCLFPLFATSVQACSQGQEDLDMDHCRCVIELKALLDVWEMRCCTSSLHEHGISCCPSNVDKVVSSQRNICHMCAGIYLTKRRQDKERSLELEALSTRKWNGLWSLSTKTYGKLDKAEPVEWAPQSALHRRQEAQTSPIPMTCAMFL